MQWLLSGPYRIDGNYLFKLRGLIVRPFLIYSSPATNQRFYGTEKGRTDGQPETRKDFWILMSQSNVIPVLASRFSRDLMLDL